MLNSEKLKIAILNSLPGRSSSSLSSIKFIFLPILNPSFINEAASICGSQSIAISVQVKKINSKWYCYTNCGRDNSNRLLLDWLPEVEKRGAGEIIITSINLTPKTRKSSTRKSTHINKYTCHL